MARPSSIGSPDGAALDSSMMAPMDGPYKPAPLRAGAGLTSSSSSSSSSLTSPASRSGDAAGAFETVMAMDEYGRTRRARCAHLPEELASIVLSFCELPQLVACARVQRQWRELAADDSLWRPMYRRCARDQMLSKLGPSIALLGHPDRDRRVDSVRFLRQHCEFLKWMLDPPVEAAWGQPQQQQQPNAGALPLAVPIQAPSAVPAASAAPAALPVALPVAHAVGAPLATAVPVAVGVAAPLAVPVPLAAPLAAAAAVPVPDLELARMFSRPPRPPPVFSASGRPALPARNTAEFVHAQRLVADALVTQGWRRLFSQLVPPHERVQTVTPTVQTAADATALPHASNSFPFPARLRPSARTPGASASPPCNDPSDASAAAAAAAASTTGMDLCSPVPSPGASADNYDADDDADGDEELSYRCPFPHANRAVEHGAVLVAWVEHPWVSFCGVSRALDDIATQVQSRMDAVAADLPVPLEGRALPLHLRLQCLHHVLYAPPGSGLAFRGNELHYYDVRNSYVHMVLRNRTGIPISLAIVYMAVAERLGIRVRGVNSPGHFLLRVEEGEGHGQGTDSPAPAAAPAAAAPSAAAAADAPVYFVDAFSGNLMSPHGALNFLSMFTGGGVDAGAAAAGDGDAASSPARHSLQLQSCTHAALFVRMYRNLMNLFQDPRTHQHQQQQQQQQLALRSLASPVSPLYQMESSLHHCASQILELLRLSGQLSPDVTTAIFIDRFRYAALLST